MEKGNKSDYCNENIKHVFFKIQHLFGNSTQLQVLGHSPERQAGLED